MDEQDITLEPNEEVEDPKAAMKSLREKLRACEVEKKEYLDGWQRTKADFVNARATEEREREQFTKYAARNVLLDIVTITDLFDIAMAQKGWGTVDSTWRSGIESIYAELQKTLSKHAVTSFGVVGEKLDTAKHQPMTTTPTDDESKDDTVAQLIKKGYILGDTVIRPAHVIIYHYQ